MFISYQLSLSLVLLFGFGCGVAIYVGFIHQGNSLSRSTTDLNLEIWFSKTSCHTKVKEDNVPYYLLIAGKRIVGFITFPRLLVLCKIQIDTNRLFQDLNWGSWILFLSDNSYALNTSVITNIIISTIQLHLLL